MNNMQNNNHNFAQNPKPKFLNLTAAKNKAAQNQSFAATVERASSIANSQTEDKIDLIETLIGDSDPRSTPFGVRHFWYKV